MCGALFNSSVEKYGESAANAFRKNLVPFVAVAERSQVYRLFTDDYLGNIVISTNDTFLLRTGSVREEGPGNSSQSLLVAGVDAQTMPIVEAAFRAKCDSEPKIDYKSKDDSAVWASSFVSPVCTGKGGVAQECVARIRLPKHRHDTLRLRTRCASS